MTEPTRALHRARLPQLALTIALALPLSGLLPLDATAPRAHAQDPGAARYNGKIVRIDADKGTLVVKAVMGHKELKIASPALLEGLKIDDPVLLTLGQQGTEVVITRVEVLR